MIVISIVTQTHIAFSFYVEKAKTDKIPNYCSYYF